MKRLPLRALLLLVVVSVGTTMLLTPAFAPHAAAYGGESSATMSCTDNTATMTRTVVVTVTWTGVGVDRMNAQAYQTSPKYVLASGSITFPLAKKGTESMTFSFSDTAPFGTEQWQLYSGAAIAAEQAGLLDAANFPGCPYP
jgi:hypothetical protein